MRDTDCIAFLQWSLPQLGLRWPGFRKVRRQVCKRISRRMKELELDTFEQYRDQLVNDREEWLVLDAACRITISRFYRDKHIFDVLTDSVLPTIFKAARNEERPVKCWCAGCASGEEVYTLAILWHANVSPQFPGIELEIVATDADPVMIARARRACYGPGSLRDMPPDWLNQAFDKFNGAYCVAAQHRQHVVFLIQDIREEMPKGPFDLVLCRNLVFTYFDASSQSDILKKTLARLRPGGCVVIGAHEQLPERDRKLIALKGCPAIFHQSKRNR